jgi:hypothetical protein
MADPAGEADRGALRLDFDRRVMLRFHGSAITSDAGLLAYRELYDVLALTASGGERPHLLVGLLRQSVFGRLAGYEDVNDADRLRRDPAMRWVVGGKAPMGRAASASQMGRFQTEWLAGPENLAALADPPGQWIDAVHQRRQLLAVDRKRVDLAILGARCEDGGGYCSGSEHRLRRCIGGRRAAVCSTPELPPITPSMRLRFSFTANGQQTSSAALVVVNMANANDGVAADCCRRRLSRD